MGIISNEVNVGLGGRMKKYYEELGYIIPRIKDKKGRFVVPNGSKIKINIKHLPLNSDEKVKVSCDYCGKEFEITYCNYNKYNHNGKYYCCNCANTVLHSGENNNRWNNNLTEEERERNRKNPEYIEFIKKVVIRDNYTCQCCNKQENNLDVHHLDGYDWCKEKRIDETNGITLCSSCHKNFHSIYGYGNNTKEQFEEWIGYALNKLNIYNKKLPTARKVYCIEEDKIYDSAIELAKEIECSNIQIYYVCNHNSHCKSVKGKHLLWADEYEKMSKEDIKDYLKKCEPKKIKIICITTNIIFNSYKEAQEYYNIKHKSGICQCCKGKKQSCGKLEDRTPLVWMYYEDYLKLNKMESE